MTTSPAIPAEEIGRFVRVSLSARDDSQRCRRIIGQLLFHLRDVLDAIEWRDNVYAQEVDWDDGHADDEYDQADALLAEAVKRANGTIPPLDDDGLLA